MVNTEIRLIIFFAVKNGEALYSQQKQDWELTVAQIMNSLLPNSDWPKKVEKTTRPFRYALNKIPYDYTVEVRNRFNRLDLIECLMNYRPRYYRPTLYRKRDQDHPQEEEMQKDKMVARGGLTNIWEEKRSEKQRIKRKINPSECRVPENS